MIISRFTIQKTFFSTSSFRLEFSKEQLNQGKEWLNNFHLHSIPRNEFEVSFSRSSGSGGQNVNKLNTKATIKMDSKKWNHCQWIPEVAKSQLIVGHFPYINKSGTITVQSELTRSRANNLEDCFNKLYNSIKSCIYFKGEAKEEDVERWQKIHEKTNNNRLQTKQRRTFKKENRKISSRDL